MAEGDFDRDTAVREIERDGDRTAFDAAGADGWRAGRGPHGGYLAAMILRALMASVPDRLRAPRSLTIHFARAPEPGPVSITTVVERAGRSLNTLSARMEQDGRMMALALSAFSVPWTGPEISELQMPVVAAPDPVRTPGTLIQENGPPFTSRIVLQHRLGGLPFAPGEQPMETGGWRGLAHDDLQSVGFQFLQRGQQRAFDREYFRPPLDRRRPHQNCPLG